MDNKIKYGYLDSVPRGTANGPNGSKPSQRRYYILYGATANSQARLDYFDNELAYKKDPKCRKTIYIEEIKHMARDPGPDKSCSFNVHMTRGENKTYHFLAGSEFEMMSWLKAIEKAQVEDRKLRSNSPFPGVDDAPILFDQNAIYESAEEIVQVFTVEIHETEAAKRCNLKIGCSYELYVLPEILCLGLKNVRVITWNYKHIRRYGCGDGNFTFEAGRKSPSGEGLFSFSVSNGNELFKIVQDQMKHLQRQKETGDEEFGRLLMNIPPNLPARNQSPEEPDTHKPKSPKPKSPDINYVLPLPERRISGGPGSNPQLNPNPQLPPKPKPPVKTSTPIKPKLMEKKSKSLEKPGDKNTHVAVFNSDVQDELASKLGVKPGVKPPMLKARGGPSSTPSVVISQPTLVTSSLSNKLKSYGRLNNNDEQYELAKSKLSLKGGIKTDSGYMEAPDDDSRVLQPSYVQGGLSQEPEYAEYDVTGSTRFTLPKDSSARESEPFYAELEGGYSEPKFPNNAKNWQKKSMKEKNNAPLVGYDTPIEAGTGKMSDILSKINSFKVEPSASEYDHIGQVNISLRKNKNGKVSEDIYNLPGET